MIRFPSWAAAAAVCAGELAHGAAAQALPRLLDLETAPATPAGSDPASLTDMGSHVLFRAYTPASGGEPFVTDGTTAGTFQLGDLLPGTASSEPVPLSHLGSRALFATHVPGTPWTGYRLWSTDRTPSGTQPFVDILGVERLPPPARAATVGSRVLFAVEEQIGQTVVAKLIATDGTAAGTTTLVQLAGILDHAVSGGRYFVTTATSELWVSDGTAAGTIPLSTNAGSSLTVRGGLVYFVDAAGSSLWATDGTRPGTTQRVIFAGNLERPELATAGDVFLRTGVALFASDGTQAGTRILTSVPTIAPWSLAAAGNRLFFLGDEPSSGQELWVSDGTVAGTRRVADLSPGPASTGFRHMAPLGNRLVFAAMRVNEGFELWSTDGTAAGTVVVASRPGAEALEPSGFAPTPSGSSLLFAATDTVAGRELWITDGLPGGTRLLADLMRTPPGTLGSSPRNLVPLGDGRVFLRASTTGSGSEPWVTDGTSAGTRLLRDVRPGAAGSSPSQAHAVSFRGRVWFNADDGITGSELWQTDGTPAGTRLAFDLVPGPDSTDPRPLAVLGERTMVLTASTPATGRELCLSDGTAAGTAIVDLTPGPASSSFARIHALGTLAAFSVGGQLWVTDGTVVGTRVLLALAPNEHVWSMAELDGVLYFNRSGSGLWRSDGTAAGTNLFIPHAALALSGILRAADGLLYFVADDGVHGMEPFASDGTIAGTRPLGDLLPGSGGSYPGDFHEIDSGVVFVTIDHALWQTRGTALSTVRVASDVAVLGVAGSRSVLLRGESGLSLSDGSASGTFPVLPHTDVGEMSVFAGKVLVVANDRIHGYEPWVVSERAMALAVGQGCGPFPPVLRAQDPVLGAQVAFTGAPLPFGSVAAVLLGAPLALPVVDAPSGCAVYVDPARVAAVLGTTVFGREFVTRLRVPLVPALAGVRLLAQGLVYPGSSRFGLDLTQGAALTLGR